jgi:hypothetical protein
MKLFIPARNNATVTHVSMQRNTLVLTVQNAGLVKVSPYDLKHFMSTVAGSGSLAGAEICGAEDVSFMALSDDEAKWLSGMEGDEGTGSAGEEEGGEARSPGEAEEVVDSDSSASSD